LSAFSTEFKKNPKNKFNENPSSGSRVVQWGQTDMTLIIAFRNIAKASQKVNVIVVYIPVTVLHRNRFIFK
jgi:hypothetical protein